MWTGAVVALLTPSTCGADEAVARYLAGVEGGSSDGVGADARFGSLDALVAVDGYVYVGDGTNRFVRRIDPVTREVTTVAGEEEPVGPGNAVDATARCLATDGAGSLFLCSVVPSGLKRLDLATGLLASLAGKTNPGSFEGWGSGASFQPPVGAAWSGGDLYVLSGPVVRRVEMPYARTSLFAGSDVLIGFRDGAGPLALFNQPSAIAADGNGNLFIADSGNFVIRRIDVHTGIVTTIAGMAGIKGGVDGPGATALFGKLGGIAVDSSGDVIVAEPETGVLRRIEAGTWAVSTWAGRRGYRGNRDGALSEATFMTPNALATDAAGNVYVGDRGSLSVRRASSGGVVTIAGPESSMLPDSFYSTPGGAMAIAGLVANDRGVFVLDALAHGVKGITVPGGLILSIAGSGSPGSSDGWGTKASFQNEGTLRSDGMLLWAQQDGKLRRIAEGTGEVVTVLEGISRQFTVTGGFVYWRSDAGRLFRRSLTGAADTRELTSAPPIWMQITSDTSGRLFVIAGGPPSFIWELSPVDGFPTLIAGSTTRGDVDGVGSNARFTYLEDICFDGLQSLYVTDRLSATVTKIRRIDLVTRAVTTIGVVPSALRVTADGLGGVFAASAETIYRLSPLIAGNVVVDSTTGGVGEQRVVHISPDAADLSAAFRFVRRPSRSQAQLLDNGPRSAVFTPDVADPFTIEAIVTSPQGGYRESLVTVTPTSSAVRCASATIVVSPPEGGTAIQPGIDFCPVGQMPVERVNGLVVLPAPGYSFAGWTVSTPGWFVLGSAMNSSTTFVTTDEARFTARLVPNADCVMVTAIRANRGTGNCQLTPVDLGFVLGSTATLVPNPYNLGNFAYWKSIGARSVSSGNPSAVFEILGSAVIEAVFAPAPPAVDSGRRFYTLAPCRLVDSRGEAPGALEGQKRAYPLSAVCGVPTTAVALSLNVTALDATGSGELRVYAAGSASSPPAVIPVRPGPARAVGAFVRLSTDSGRAVIVETASGSGTTHFILDVNGYWQ